MKYTVTSKAIREDAVVTEVEYVMDTGETVKASVVHFRPEKLADVELGIINRGKSEEAKLLAAAKCATVVASIETGKQVIVETVAPK